MLIHFPILLSRGKNRVGAHNDESRSQSMLIGKKPSLNKQWH